MTTDQEQLKAARRRLLPLGLTEARGPTILLLLTTTANMVLGLLGAVLGARLIGDVPGGVADGWSSAAGDALRLSLALVGIVFLARHLVSAFGAAISHVTRISVDRALQHRVMGLAADAPGVAHLEDPAIADLVANARGIGFTGISPGMAVQGWVSVAGVRIGAVLAAAILISIEWWLPLGIAAVSLLMLRTMVRHMWAGVELTMGATSNRRKANYLADLALRPTAAKEVRVFGLGRWLRSEHAAEFASATEGVWDTQVSSRRTLVVPVLLSWVVTTATMLGVVELVQRGALDLGQIALVALLLSQVRGGLTNIDNNLLQVEHGVQSLPAIDELERRLRDDPVVQLAGTLDAGDRPTRSIEFEKVHFTYPGTDTPIYAGLDLTIEAGTSVAIVGVTGAGKTTLVKLLARLYDPTEGRILIDGTPLTDIDPRSWQPRVSAIFQDFVRYELSARENVAFGAPNRKVSHAEIEQAAADAGILDAIEALPKGWDTVLSRRYEDGADLSGGQWQRLALARALLAVRAGAGVLVLDEPTANLDVRAEAELYDRFLELTAGVTSVVISHRFSTVRRADRIVVIEHGRVVEDGSHGELVGLDGRYAAAFSVQAARFVGDGAAGEVAL